MLNLIYKSNNIRKGFNLALSLWKNFGSGTLSSFPELVMTVGLDDPAWLVTLRVGLGTLLLFASDMMLCAPIRTDT